MRLTRRSLPTPTPGLPSTRGTIALLVGDLLVLFAFVAAGQYAHHYYFWQLPVHTVMVLLPFLVAWLVIAPLAGLYRRETVGNYTATLLGVVPAWIAVSLLGGAIRSTALFPGNAPIDFLAANVGVGLLFVLPWRLVACLVFRYGRS